MCLYAGEDVANGFGLLPTGQHNVIVGDDVYIECKANEFVFSPPNLYRVDGVTETWLTTGDGVEITRNT